jgi:ribonuclease BN (tRNA processing enzyme)
MRVKFLGTAGYHPNEARQTMCVMLPDIGFVLDAGTGFFRVREHLKTEELHVFLSHVHLDHVVGLTYLLDVLWEKPVKRVRVYGLPSHLDTIERKLFNSLLFPLPFQYKLQPIHPRFRVRGVRVRTNILEHPGDSVAYRFQGEDWSLAYVTDVSASPEYHDLIEGVDLLIHECNFTDKYRELALQSYHSYTTAVLRTAQEANVRQLVLTHINPLLDDGSLEAEVNAPYAQVAYDGMEMKIGVME